MKPLLFRLLFPKLEISYAVVCVDMKFSSGYGPLFYLHNHLLSKEFLFFDEQLCQIHELRVLSFWKIDDGDISVKNVCTQEIH